jgi:hypothetical protein
MRLIHRPPVRLFVSVEIRRTRFDRSQVLSDISRIVFSSREMMITIVQSQT